MKINEINNNYYYSNNNIIINNNNNNNNNNNKGDNDYDINKRLEKLIENLINIRWNKCKYIYWNCIITHIYTLLLNIKLIFLLNFLLQGRFLSYLTNTYPFKRDIHHFSDNMSQIFFPFSECKVKFLTPRTENITCHLTLMEYYEKIFFIVWLYLIILPIFTFLNLLYLSLGFRNNYNSFFVHLLKKHLNYNLFLTAENIIKKNKEFCIYHYYSHDADAKVV